VAGVIVLDASVLIAHLNRDDASRAVADQLLLETADHPLAASTITLAEVLVRPAQAGKLEVARTALAELGVGEVQLPPDAAKRLAQLRAETGLRLPDCCVLLAAEVANADAVLTFDERLAKRTRELGYELEPPATDDDS
jgi:predicted nucleic acid-binding protein